MLLLRAMKYLIGVDEAGRAPLAGPVLVGADSFLFLADVLSFMHENSTDIYTESKSGLARLVEESCRYIARSQTEPSQRA